MILISSIHRGRGCNSSYYMLMRPAASRLSYHVLSQNSYSN